jgi:hypothetical protein
MRHVRFARFPTLPFVLLLGKLDRFQDDFVFEYGEQRHVHALDDVSFAFSFRRYPSDIATTLVVVAVLITF